MINVYEAIDANKRKSFLVIVFFALFVALAGSAFIWLTDGSPALLVMALVMAAVSSFAGYWWSDSIVLTLMKAKEANRSDYFNFYTVAENLSLAAQIPKPKLYVMDSLASNAFATGRDVNHAAVAVTRGLLEKLNRSELEAVVGHEIAHIKSYDTRLMVVVSVLIGTIALLGDLFLRNTFFGLGSDRKEQKSGGALFVIGIIFIVLSPLIGRLIQLAISRRREYSADALSVKLTRNPMALSSALEKISRDPVQLETASSANAHLFIDSPFKGRQKTSWLVKVFSTHPPIEDRLRALEAMQ